MTYKILAARPLHIRLRRHSGKTTFQPGASVKLPEEVAEMYLRLGLIEEEGSGASKRATPAKAAAPAKRDTPALRRATVQKKSLTEKLAKAENVGHVPQSPN